TAEIINVGNEVTSGAVVNTDAAYIAARLFELGVTCYALTSVDDDPRRLALTLLLALSRSDTVILSGGLGPTDDDLTKETVAKVLGLSLVEDKKVLGDLQNYFAKKGDVLPQKAKKQAMVIQGAKVLYNTNGTAPGFIVEIKHKTVIVLPGPYSELTEMFGLYVIPYLKEKTNRSRATVILNVAGIGESSVEEKLRGLTRLSNPVIATYVHGGEVELKITAEDKNGKKAQEMCRIFADRLKEYFGKHIYGENYNSVEEKVVEQLKEKGFTISTAESCTAGLVSNRITAVSGASSVFEMGVVAYADEIKINALGVKADTIKTYGAISEQTAAQMAQNVIKLTKSNLGISVTGNAGPTASENKPVGLVYIGLSDGKKTAVRKLELSGNRERIRMFSAAYALDMARRYLDNDPDLLSRMTAVGEKIVPFSSYILPIPCEFEDLLLLCTKKQEGEGLKFFETDNKGDASGGKHDKKDAATAQSKENGGKNEKDIAWLLQAGKVRFNALMEKLSEYGEESSSDGEPEFTPTEFMSEQEFVEAFGEGDHKSLDVKEISDKTAYTLQKKYEQFKAARKNAKEERARLKEEQKNMPKVKKGFVKTVFPYKGDRLPTVLLKCLCLLTAAAIIFCGVCVGKYFYDNNKNREFIADCANNFKKAEAYIPGKRGILKGFTPLIKQNSECIGWLTVEQTGISLPLYQTRDNDFYQTHGTDKRYLDGGTPFIDCASLITADEHSQNIVIYGRKNNGLQNLEKYRDINFYKKNPLVSFADLWGIHQYKIFAVALVNTDPADDNGNVFNYRYSRFDGNNALIEYANALKKRSMINTKIDVDYADNIITLSIPANDFDSARLLVAARELREDETIAVDTEIAEYNQDCIYPKAYKSTSKQ
ncbi:MAG: competence/damage-inducible protein A, partial [Oscillospiraceae bacterium]|nr:competence/damage-inducible protein A [Candidatus Equicaccousia limihippi]